MFVYECVCILFILYIKIKNLIILAKYYYLQIINI